MAAKLIEKFLPDLVTAISDSVQPVSDQCLAKGLIPDSVYKRDKLFLLLIEYIQWYPGDRRGSTSFATYSAIQTTLMNLRLSLAVHIMCTYNTCCQLRH